jgi:hypothetical protein
MIRAAGRTGGDWMTRSAKGPKPEIVGRYDATPASSWEKARAFLLPGESLVAITDCTLLPRHQIGGTTRHVTLALTTQHLKVLDRFTDGEEAIRLDRIASLTTRSSMEWRRTKGSFKEWQGDTYAFDVALLDGSARKFQAERPDAADFVDEFRTTVARQQASSASDSDPASELERLASLASDGLLTQDEWTRAKDLYLGKPPDVREEALRLLRTLHELHRDGVLSEAEFNMKKWDVLSRTK